MCRQKICRLRLDVSKKIPKVIYMTTAISLKKVPDLLKDKANGYEIRLYNDNAAKAFLKRVWGDDILTRFEKLKKGAHKMDLWRYCMLYMYGGIYLDIKTIPVVNIQTIFTDTDTWYTCLSAYRGCYQGIIATPPKNQILLHCINKVMTTTDKAIDSNYLLLTTQMQDICKAVYYSPCNTPGKYVCKKDSDIPSLVLFQEKCDLNECRLTRRDKYGVCCNIRNDQFDHLFRTRHENYPWKTLPKGETSIENHPNLKVFS